MKRGYTGEDRVMRSAEHCDLAVLIEGGTPLWDGLAKGGDGYGG